MPRDNRTYRAMLLAAALAVPLLCLGLRAPAAPAENSFSGARAFEDLKHLVSFGPRPAGSEPLDKSRRWMVGQLEQMGYKVIEDIFQGITPFGSVTMVNVRVVIPGDSPKVIMLAGHYDTKRFLEFNFAGANDGGSSAAFLMEMARVLQHRKNKYTIWIVWFDGEEAMVNWTAADSLYGSRHMVEALTANGELGQIQAMLLVDMIGDAKLDVYRDGDSTPWLADVVFDTAKRLGLSKYFINEERGYQDDHSPFINAGVSALDIIDGNYGPQSSNQPFGAYWHTAKDTLDKCSPASLAIVGRVVMGSIEALEKSPRLK